VQKRTEIRIAGLGGQGVVLAGEILGRAAVYDGKHAVQTQSYGAEARGSGAKSELIIADGKIGFPVVRKCDVLVAMSQTALEKNLKDLKPDGVLMVDERVVKELPKATILARFKVFKVPATETAETRFKSKIYANMVMLGFLTGVTGVVSQTVVEKAIEDSVPAEVRENDISGFRAGLELAEHIR